MAGGGGGVHHTLIRQQKNDQSLSELKNECSTLTSQLHHTLNSRPHMTNARWVIIQEPLGRGRSQEARTNPRSFIGTD